VRRAAAFVSIFKDTEAAATLAAFTVSMFCALPFLLGCAELLAARLGPPTKLAASPALKEEEAVPDTMIELCGENTAAAAAAAAEVTEALPDTDMEIDWWW
jgi:hypothetical protein